MSIVSSSRRLVSSTVKRAAAVLSHPARSIATVSSAGSHSRSGWRNAGMAAAALIGMSAYALSTSTAQADENHGGLTPKAYVPLKLLSVMKYNHNTSIFKFALPDPTATLDLPISSFVMVRFIDENGKEVARPYTPIAQDTPGVLHLLVKDYPAGVVSSHIHKLQPGQTLDVKGPIAKLKYTPNKWKEVGMVAGGTGITPMLQVLTEALRNPNDQTKFNLVFANTSFKDILLREYLDNLVATSNGRLNVTYVIDTKPEDRDWSGEIGYISESLLKKYLPKPSNDTLVYVCGPPGLMKLVSGPKAPDYTQGEVDGILKNLNYPKEQVFKF